MTIPRALTIATSDSGGGAGIQADLKAFAAAGAYGTSVLVALTAQNTVGVTAIHELPPAFVRAQLDAVFDDIGVDAAKTGMLFSRALIETVADYLAGAPVPLVVDPVMVASSGAKLLEDDAVERACRLALSARDRRDAEPARGEGATGRDGPRRELAERLHELGARAVIVTGGHGDDASTISSTAASTSRFPSSATTSLRRTAPAARTRRRSRRSLRAARASSMRRAGARGRSSRAVAQGLVEIGSGEGPVDVLGVASAMSSAGTTLRRCGSRSRSSTRSRTTSS